MNKVVNDCGAQPTEEAKTGMSLTPCPKCTKHTLAEYIIEYANESWGEDYVVYCTVKTCDYREGV